MRRDETDDEREQHGAGADERDAHTLALALDVGRGGSIRVAGLAIGEQRCAFGIAGGAHRRRGHGAVREESEASTVEPRIDAAGEPRLASCVDTYTNCTETGYDN